MPLDERQREGLLELEFAEVRFDEPLAPHTWLRVGGPADALVLLADAEQLRLARRWCRRQRVASQPLPVGAGLLVRDGGFSGLTLATATDDSDLVAAISRLATWEERSAGPQLPRGRDRLFADPDLRQEASRLLGDAGVAGIRLRGARISSTDPNVVVNEDDATAHDVVTLADWARRQVEARTGVKLASALQLVGRRQS